MSILLKRGHHTQVKNILDTCMKYVPESGFEDALTKGIREGGFSDATHAAITPFDLVKHHLTTQRQALASVTLPETKSSYDKLEYLMVERLKANNVIQPRLKEAISIMTKPANMTQSLQELHELSDEFWWLAMDRTSDFSWYTKRAAVSSVYVASEMFMTRDTSSNYRDTMSFAQHRLREAERAGYACDSSMEWLKFSGIASFNLLKSLTRG